MPFGYKKSILALKMPSLKICLFSANSVKYFAQTINFNVSSSSPSPPPPAVFHGGNLPVRKCHGGHAGQRGHLSDHRRAHAEHGSCAEHPEPHAFLRHVRLLRRVCLPRECHRSPGSCCWVQVSPDVLLPPLQVGLPAKSGVSGAVLLVVPNVMGMMCWSPPLDRSGNSVRGIHFCQVINHRGSINASCRLPSIY